MYKGKQTKKEKEVVELLKKRVAHVQSDPMAAALCSMSVEELMALRNYVIKAKCATGAR